MTTCRVCDCSSSVFHAFPTALLAISSSSYSHTGRVGAWNCWIGVTLTSVLDLADSTPIKKWRQRGTYLQGQRSREDRKYALENGNTREKRHLQLSSLTSKKVSLEISRKLTSRICIINKSNCSNRNPVTAPEDLHPTTAARSWCEIAFASESNP